MTTNRFLEHFGLGSLRELPDLDALEDAGLLSRHAQPAGTMPIGAPVDEDEEGQDDAILGES